MDGGYQSESECKTSKEFCKYLMGEWVWGMVVRGWGLGVGCVFIGVGGVLDGIWYIIL